MQFEEKYEWVTQVAHGKPAKAIQRRLGREVVIHPIRKSDVAKPVREICGQLGRLDHPAIPHLIDFVDSGDEYRLIIESPANAEDCWLENLPAELLDRLAVIEQLVDSLHHAKQSGIYHGRISSEVLSWDEHGALRVQDFGLAQLSTHDLRDAKELEVADVEAVCRLIENCIGEGIEGDNLSPVDAGQADADETRIGSDLVRQLAEIREILQRCQTSETRTIEFLHQAISSWVAGEQTAREARRLAVSDQPEALNEEESRPSIPTRTFVLVGAIALVSLFLLGLIIWWPSNTETEDLAKPSATSVAKNDKKPKSVDDFGDDVEQPLDEMASTELASSAISTPRPGKVLSAPESLDEKALEMSPAAANASQQIPAPSTTTRIPTASPKNDKSKEEARSKNPFENAVRALTLPHLDGGEPFSLLMSTLREDEPLEIKLAGGVGAFKQGEYLLARAENRWQVLYQDKATSRALALINRTEDRLTFSWQNDEAIVDKRLDNIKLHLANTVLEVTSGRWKHAVALREYKQLPVLSANLERRKPYEFRIENMPNTDEVFVEFVSKEKALAVAFGKNLIPSTKTMRIGLEARKKSLFAVGIEPRFRNSKQTLFLKAFGRPDPKRKFIALPRAYGRTLRSNLKQAAMNIFRLSAAKERANDEQEKQIGKQIALLKSDKETLERLLDSYEAATLTQLEFNIYRKVGSHRVPLAKLGAEKN